LKTSAGGTHDLSIREQAEDCGVEKTQKAQVKVYSIQWCPYCEAAKRLLDELGIAFEEIDLSTHPNRQEFTSSLLPGHRTAPLVLIDDEPIGGNAELQELYASGELEKRVFEGE
jgi:glutaredoxin 3